LAKIGKGIVPVQNTSMVMTIRIPTPQAVPLDCFIPATVFEMLAHTPAGFLSPAAAQTVTRLWPLPECR